MQKHTPHLAKDHSLNSQGVMLLATSLSRPGFGFFFFSFSLWALHFSLTIIPKSQKQHHIVLSRQQTVCSLNGRLFHTRNSSKLCHTALDTAKYLTSAFPAISWDKTRVEHAAKYQQVKEAERVSQNRRTRQNSKHTLCPTWSRLLPATVSLERFPPA